MLNAVQNYFMRHAQNCLGALGNMVRQPVASGLTIGVIGIALAMPVALNTIVQNGRSVAGSLDNIRDFSVYVTPGTALIHVERLQTRIRKMPVIESTELIPADEALETFRKDTEFGALVTALDSNPLPHTLIIRPDEAADPAALENLKSELAKETIVDLIKLDTEWVQRLNALLDLARRAVWLAAITLIGAVIVIVGNTIRLDIQSRRAEIEVSKLLGASDRFVRRPFLYTGFWYGFLGSVFAILLLVISFWLLSGPVEKLIQLYGGGFEPFGLGAGSLLGVFLIGLTTGLAGAWLAVSRHLADIQPRI